MTWGRRPEATTVGMGGCASGNQSGTANRLRISALVKLALLPGTRWIAVASCAAGACVRAELMANAQMGACAGGGADALLATAEVTNTTMQAVAAMSLLKLVSRPCR